MKKLFAAAIAITAIAAPVQAQSISESADNFCVNMRRHANGNGMSAAPGTPFATLVAAKANQSAATYAQLWAVAKASGSSNCRAMY